VESNKILILIFSTFLLLADIPMVQFSDMTPKTNPIEATASQQVAILYRKAQQFLSI